MPTVAGAWGPRGCDSGHARPHVWIHGSNPARFSTVLPALRALEAAFPRCGLLLTVDHAAGRRIVGHLYSDALVTAPPVEIGPIVRGFVASFDPRVLVRLEPTRGPGRVTRAVLRRRGCETLTVGESDGPESIQRLAGDVVRLLRSAPVRGSNRPGWLMLARGHRIDTLEELSRQLGGPECILCLGNGPSVRAPELARESFDCLFRVNWRWAPDPRFARPQMVFSGDGSGLTVNKECIVGTRTGAEAAGILRSRRLRPWPWRIRYATLDTMPLALTGAWAARPTNGAAMIATAAALQPARLAIAGVDLFEHPDGAYPDDPMTPNAYLHMHDRNVEVAIVRAALAQYRGEAVVLSPPLRARLASAGAGRPVAAP